ncbi:Hsp20 family protein [Aliidiomarina maris]|uniref:Heat-shock protein n=1 Tax=Aliidiomarina maris TaxID=531312 RepID=A0A327WZK6_9GAMM|nr:Hsp20 family protein [Aliidiomarina maris]MCL5049698.1 Hsp20 family protein [Bacillota bacterium]RAJ99065.1 molecular chaperone IbpA [Aliidiomarina maris]RUO27771.1 heat-shock protein [Aliidiomarina maris]
MNNIDLTPLYRSSIGFDRLASMLDSALRSDTSSGGYPPYNIEALGENRYGITIAVAGFEQSELDIQVERGVLTVRGRKTEDDKGRKYLYQGIAARAFERKFNLAEHVEVTDAELRNGLLNIHLVKEIPEAEKARSISIKDTAKSLEHKQS